MAKSASPCNRRTSPHSQSGAGRELELPASAFRASAHLVEQLAEEHAAAAALPDRSRATAFAAESAALKAASDGDIRFRRALATPTPIMPRATSALLSALILPWLISAMRSPPRITTSNVSPSAMRLVSGPVGPNAATQPCDRWSFELCDDLLERRLHGGGDQGLDLGGLCAFLQQTIQA